MFGEERSNGLASMLRSRRNGEIFGRIGDGIVVVVVVLVLVVIC